MKTDRISRRQFLAIMFLAFLSPAARLLPRRTAAVAGSGAWLSCALALLPVMAGAYVMTQSMGEEDYGMVLQSAFGNSAGTVLRFLYGLWLFCLASLCVRFYGERFLSTSYVGAKLWLFTGAFLAFVLVILRQKFSCFARACGVYAILIAMLLLIVDCFSLPEAKLTNLLPIVETGAAGLLRGVFSVMSVASVFLYSSFLRTKINPSRKRSGLYGGLATIMLTFAMMVLLVIGVLSPAYVANMQVPFFVMVKNIRVAQVFERVDSFVLAFFVMSDAAYCAMALFAARQALGITENRKWWPWCAVAVCFAVAMAAPTYFDIEYISEKVVQPVNLILGWAVPLAACILKKIREKF